MTEASEAQPLRFDTYEDAIGAIRAQGLRLSTARRLILEALFAAPEPVSAERISAGLSLDPASVYRNLETLERHGLVRHVHLGHGAGLYELVGRGEREYLYCSHCGAVRALSPEQLDPIRGKVKELFGYEARFTHFAIVGLCPSCAKTAPAEEHARHEHARGEQLHANPHPKHGGDRGE
jgi:Fur family transcriptional regulator, ferric uptake regulator